MNSVDNINNNINNNNNNRNGQPDFFAGIGPFNEALVYFYCTRCVLPPPSDSLLPLSLLYHTSNKLRSLRRLTFAKLVAIVRGAYRPLARMQQVSRVFVCSPLMPSLADIMRHVRSEYGFFAPGTRQIFSYETDRFLQRTDDPIALDCAARCLFTTGLDDFETMPLTTEMDVVQVLTLGGSPPLIDVNSLANYARASVQSDQLARSQRIQGAQAKARLCVPVIVTDASLGPATFRLRFLDELDPCFSFSSISAVFNGRQGLQVASIRERGAAPAEAATFRKMATFYKDSVEKWAARVHRSRQTLYKLMERTSTLISAQKMVERLVTHGSRRSWVQSVTTR